MMASGLSLRASATPSLPFARRDHAEPLELERVPQPEHDVRLVLDDEDGLLGAAGWTSGAVRKARGSRASLLDATVALTVDRAAKRLPQRLHVARRHPGHREQLLVGRRLHGRQVPDVFRSAFFVLRAEPRHVVERRAHPALLAEALRARFENRCASSRARARKKSDAVWLLSGIGFFWPGQVDAIDQRVAQHVLLLLRQRHDRHLVEPEVVRRRERDLELARAPVHDEEIRQLPVDVVRALAGLASLRTGTPGSRPSLPSSPQPPLRGERASLSLSTRPRPAGARPG